MALLTLLLLVLEICVAVKSEVELQKRIIGGKDCDSNERRYHVKLTANNKTHESLCGGSLISDQWVLTAAHCWKDEPGWVHTAVVGVHPGPGTPLTVTHKVIYTDKKKQQHDIMLVKLPEKITTITPVQLPDCKNKVVVANVKIAGFAAATRGAKGEKVPAPPSAVLQCAEFDVVDCKTHNPNLGNGLSYEHVFCVEKTPNVDTCRGDSGGGAIHDTVIYGVHVTTGAYICAVSSREMDVCKFEEWISKTIDPNCPTFSCLG